MNREEWEADMHQHFRHLRRMLDEVEHDGKPYIQQAAIDIGHIAIEVEGLQKRFGLACRRPDVMIETEATAELARRGFNYNVGHDLRGEGDLKCMGVVEWEHSQCSAIWVSLYEMEDGSAQALIQWFGRDAYDGGNLSAFIKKLDELLAHTVS